MGIKGLSEKDLKDLAALYLSCNEKREGIDPQTAGLIIFEMMLRRCHKFDYDVELQSVSADDSIFTNSYISKDADNNYVYVGFDQGDAVDHLPMISVYDNEKYSSVEFSFNGLYENLESHNYTEEERKKYINFIQAKIAEAAEKRNEDSTIKNRL